MPDLSKNRGKMPDLAFFGAKLYYKNAIKIDKAEIVVFAKVPDLDLIQPGNPNPNYEYKMSLSH
jgi:hypothetical protein